MQLPEGLYRFQGVFAADVAPTALDCHQYYFTWEDAAGREAVFPEDGSYTYGEACTDGVGWVSGHLAVGGDNGTGGGNNGGGMDGLDESGNPLTAGAPKLIGCSSSGGSASLVALVLAGACILPVAGRRGQRHVAVALALAVAVRRARGEP